MGTTSSQFYPRAPRYTLKAQDHNQLRFALMQTRGHAFDTELKDVSTSGLKFSIPNASEGQRGLDEGEIIKIEFKIPNGKQIACFGTVVRVEHVNEWDPEFGDQFTTQVAVQFRHLPKAFSNALKNSLPKKESNEQDIYIPVMPSNVNTKTLLMFSLSSVALLSLFVFLCSSPAQWLGWFK